MTPLLLIPIFSTTRYLHGKGSLPKAAALAIYAVSTAALLPTSPIHAAIVGVLIALGFIPGWTSAQQAALDGVVQPGVTPDWWMPFMPDDRITGAMAMSWRWLLFFAPAFVALQSTAFLGLWLTVGPIYALCGKYVKRDSSGSGAWPNRVAEPLSAALLAGLLLFASS